MVVVWGETPHMTVKHSGCTSIHNKALYKCIINSLVHWHSYFKRYFVLYIFLSFTFSIAHSTVSYFRNSPLFQNAVINIYINKTRKSSEARENQTRIKLIIIITLRIMTCHHVIVFSVTCLWFCLSVMISSFAPRTVSHATQFEQAS